MRNRPTRYLQGPLPRRWGAERVGRFWAAALGLETDTHHGSAVRVAGPPPQPTL
ncbi:hypothetical protein [Pseudonocardia sp.]|uniref:hypothetical protein n=1 Tax=Pseudonocardia sp. TaxID=60912 RepID=UPI0031FC2E4D